MSTGASEIKYLAQGYNRGENYIVRYLSSGVSITNPALPLELSPLNVNSTSIDYYREPHLTP